MNIYRHFAGRLSALAVLKVKGHASRVVNVHLIRSALGTQSSWTESTFLEVVRQFWLFGGTH